MDTYNYTCIHVDEHVDIIIHVDEHVDIYMYIDELIITQCIPVIQYMIMISCDLPSVHCAVP